MSLYPEQYQFSCFQASTNIDETEDRISRQTKIELETWRRIFGGGEDRTGGSNQGEPECFLSNTHRPQLSPP